MKTIKNKLILLCFAVFAAPYLGSAQDSLSLELSYGVYINYPPLAIPKKTLLNANTIKDLIPHYKPSWVKEYISVELFTSHKGERLKVLAKDNRFTEEQKEHLRRVDEGSDITIKVHYIPNNTLKHNDPKEMSFTFTVDPDDEAQFPGGKQQLQQYLKENIMDKISEASFKQYQLAAVKFTIDEVGKIRQPQVFWSAEDKKIDQLFLESIHNMPNWKPARYADGTKVKQDLVLLVGDMKSCVANMVNIRPNPRTKQE